MTKSLYIKKRKKLKKTSSYGKTISTWSTSGRELSLPSPACLRRGFGRQARTSGRLVPPGVNRSFNTNRVPSHEDLYKAVYERDRSRTITIKEERVMFTIGIDWADEHHDVCVVNESGEKADSFRINHDPEGLSSLRDRIRRLGVSKDQVLFAIETHKNLVVDFLLDEGYSVYSINPKSVERYRERYRVSGAKDDTFDAMVLANIIRTDRHQYQPIMPSSPLARELKILTQDEQRLIHHKTKLVNQIESCLKDYYPAALKLFSEIAQPITLAFLGLYPTPRKLSFKELRRFLHKNHYPGVESKAEEMFTLLSNQIFVEEFASRAKARMLTALVEQLKVLLLSLAEYRKEIDKLFEEHDDADIFKGLPGSGEKIAPRMLSEIGDNRERFTDKDNLQCYAGTAPITRQSGKTSVVHMRFSCNKRLRNILYQFAFTSLSQSPWSRNFYDSQRAKGNSHAKALRALSDKWVKIIYHLWKNKEHYSEDKHLADIMRFRFNSCSVA